MAVKELGSINIFVDNLGNCNAEVNTDHANPNGLQLSEMLCDFADRINRSMQSQSSTASLQQRTSCAKM